MMHKQFKIGEISRLYHIGADSLRYYEEIGLIRPRRSESGYRLYSQQDIWRLNVIRDLRELGFPTEAIRAYLDVQSTDTALELLEAEKDAITCKLQSLQKLQQNVQQRMDTIRRALSLPLEQISRRTLPDRRCYRTDGGYSTDAEMDLLIKELLNRSGSSYIIGNNQLGSLISRQEDGSLRYEAVFAMDPAGDRVIPGGEFLCLTYRGSYSATPCWVERLLEQAAAQKLRVRGPALEILWIDIHTTQRTEEHITELQLPVEAGEPG